VDQPATVTGSIAYASWIDRPVCVAFTQEIQPR